MENQVGNQAHLPSSDADRGGIRLRDYTSSGLPPALARGFSFGKLKNGWQHINFDNVGRGMILSTLGLGLFQILAPRRFLQMIGVRDKKYTGLVRGIGFRELSSAGLLFSQHRPFAGMLSRVIGDAMDLGLLFAAWNTRRADKKRLAITTGIIGAITAADTLTTMQINRVKEEAQQESDFTQEDMDTRTPDGAFQVTRSITINRPADELYRYWRNFENLPNFMYHLVSVTVIDQRRSHWVAKAPAGQTVQWEAEITQERPNQWIAWRSLPGADVPNSGEVRFEVAPQHFGTVVRVRIEYHPPAGALGKIVAKVFGEEPGQQVSDDLRRFKLVMETGEVLISDGTPHGSGQKMQRPARALRQPREGRRILGIKIGGNKGETKWDEQVKQPEREHLPDAIQE